MKVLHISHSLNTGGLEKCVFHLAHGLMDRGVSVLVCALARELALREEFVQHHVPVFTMDKTPGLQAGLIVRLMSLIRREHVEIVHTHNAGAWLYGGLAAKLSGRRLVHTEHSNLFEHQNRLIAAERWLEGMTDRIVCDSEKVRLQMIQGQGLKGKRMRTILNGIPMEEPVPSGEKLSRETLLPGSGIQDGDLVIGAVGRMVPEKDYETMLQAFALLARRMERTWLVIVGDGPGRPALEERVRNFGLDQRVVLTGERRDVPALLTVFDLFLMTSVSEGLPMALLEAMAAGLPVIATRVGGIPEVVVDGQTGFLIPPKDPGAAVRGCEQILAEPDLARAMGRSGRERVRELCSQDSMVKQYLDVYREALGKK